MKLRENILKNIIRFEQYSLFLCIFSIPLFESPKTIFLLITAVLFSIRHFIEKDWKEMLFIKDPRLGFLALTLAAFISAIFAQKPELAVHGGFDFLKMYILFLIVATDFLDKKSIKSIGIIVIVSTAIGAIWGITEYATGKSATIELHSVGHVNHSAIYLALALVLAIPFLRLLEGRPEKIFISLSSVIILISLILTGSRATILGITAALIVMFIFTKGKKQSAYAFTAVIAAAVIISISVPDLQLLQKNTSLSDMSLIHRIKLWENAWEMFTLHPVVGVGAKHFKFYNTLDSGSHAHNLYFNTVAQLGIVGFISLASLFYLIIKSLKAYNNRESLLWTAALGAFIIVLVNGIFNTTLHSEHGLLFALILALGLNNNHGRRLQEREHGFAHAREEGRVKEIPNGRRESQGICNIARLSSDK